MTPTPNRLLVVDDNEMNRDMLSRRLQKQGHTVETAENGRQALEKVRAGEFDLVLLDIMMPEMDGYEVLAALKADEALRHIPVVMISAVSEIDSVVKCLELGAEDYLPKPFNPVILKARVGSSLDRKRYRDRERLYAKSMERELEIGRSIQAGFFPDELPRPEGWEIAAHFTPARQCSGDFYDAFTLPGGHVALVIADVCDKGVGAALFMALFRSLLRALACQDHGPATAREILSRTVTFTNDYIAQTHGKANMFATVFFGLLDPGDGSLTYINAGHEAPMLVTAGRVRDLLRPTGPALGMLPSMPFAIGSAVLQPGETLFTFTDGVPEAKGPEGFFGEDRVLAVLSEDAPSAASLLKKLEDDLARHVGDFDRYDDVTLLVVRRR